MIPDSPCSNSRPGTVAIHTGGGYYSKSLVEKIKPFCQEACNAGLDQLLQSNSAVDAVTEAISVLENCPYLNAGRGANLNRAGIPELDASLIDGTDVSFGSVSCCSTLVNPIRAARMLLDNCKKGVDRSGLILPFMLSGSGASHFGTEMGLKTCAPEELITPDSYRDYSEELNHLLPVFQSTAHAGNSEKYSTPSDTVGAVCIDSNGGIAAGCSSGGLLLKHPGRIGPAAVMGSGCFAKSTPNTSVACCTSGTGEILLRSQLARCYCEAVSSSPNPEPFSPLQTILTRDIIHNPNFSCYPDRFTAVLGLCATGERDVEVIWGHNTPQFVLAYQSVCMKKPKFLVSKLSSSSSEAYSISSALLKF